MALPLPVAPRPFFLFRHFPLAHTHAHSCGLNCSYCSVFVLRPSPWPPRRIRYFITSNVLLPLLRSSLLSLSSLRLSQLAFLSRRRSRSRCLGQRRCLRRRRCPVCFFFLFLIEICGLHQYLLFPCVFHVIKNLVQVFLSLFFCSVSPVLCCLCFWYNIILQDGWDMARTFQFPDFPDLFTVLRL